MSYRATKAELALCRGGDCTRCGGEAKIRNSAGRCMTCHNLEYNERKAERKAELAAMPRCEAPKGCGRRGTWHVGNPTPDGRRALLCGQHKKQVDRKVAGFGSFGMFIVWDGDRGAVLALLTEGVK